MSHRQPARPQRRSARAALALVGLVSLRAGEASAQLVHTFTAPPAERVDFAVTMAVVGSRVVVGDPRARPGGSTDYGAAYVFDAASGALERVLVAPDGRSGQFGYAVASAGDRVLVGAPSETVGDELWAGAVYVFDPASGALVHRIANPRPSNNDNFGDVLAGTSDWIAVGLDFGSNGPGIHRGRVDVFDAGTGAHVRTIPSPTATATQSGGSFGEAVAISGDELFVGAPDTFVANHSFAGVVYAFHVATEEPPSRIERAADFRVSFFGRSLKAVGDELLVGSSFTDPDNDSVGAAFRYATDGTFLQAFAGPDGGHGDHFGYTLDRLGDAVLVGAPGAWGRGAAHLFDASSGELLQSFRRPPSDRTYSGFGLAVASFGPLAVVADWGTREVYAFATCAALGDGAVCDDGNACTPASACDVGACRGAVAPCAVGQCQQDLGCNPEFGCTVWPKPNGTACAAEPDGPCAEADTCQYGACVDGGSGDLDEDQVCSVDDNCPHDANPEQGDLDGDGDGDRCDGSDGELRIAHARLDFARSDRPASARLQLRGSFARAGIPFDVADGVALTAYVGWAGPLSLYWSGDECRQRGERALCRSASGDAVLRVVPLRTRAGEAPRWSVVIRARKLAVAGPPAGPLHVALSNAPGVPLHGIDRIGLVEECSVRRTSLTCAQP